MKKPLYIFSSGELKRKDNTIFFENEQGKKYIPVENTNEIFIFGEVDINKRFLEFLTQSKIILHFFNRYNYYVGSFYPREHLNSGYMILRQAENYLDYEKRLLIAKEFVLGAVGNILRVIGYYRRRGKKLENIEASIKALAEKIPAGSTIEELMALEGNVRGYYYRTFDSILNNSDFIFHQRSKRPPKNNLNTLISFGNSLLYVIILSEIFQTHLDPRIGFLHATNFRRFSLNLDVAEIFKPIIVDRLIFKLVGKRMLTKNDFESGTESLMMKEKARHLFVTELDNKLKSTISYHSLGRNVSYRRLIRLELYKLEKHLMDEKEYEPFLAKW